MQNPIRTTSRTSLKQDIEFIELTEQGKKEPELLSILLKQCEHETASWLINKEQIRTWSELKNFTKNLKENSDNNNLVKIVCNRRKYNENINEYITTIREKLLPFDLSEEAMITIIATNIWPGDTQTINNLMNAKNIDNLINMIEDINKIKKQTIYCTNCNRNGHATSKCRNTTLKQNL